MEKVIRRVKNPILLVILGILATAAVAVGIYFLVTGKHNEPPNGTYVTTQFERRIQG